MIPDAFLPNLLIFLLGQLAACGYLRTGLVHVGVRILVLTWVSADIALVARFGYGSDGGVYRTALLVSQLTAIVAAVLFVLGRVRRRLPKNVARREEMFREAFVHYLKDDLQPAVKLYERLMRIDPWDAPSRMGLATVLARSGKSARARRVLRAVRSLDSKHEFRDAIELESR